MKSKYIILSAISLFLFLGLISFISGAISFSTSDANHYISISNEGTSASPIGFKNITDYFKANPIDSNLKMPKSGDLAENNSAGWNLSTGNISIPTLNNFLNTTGNYSINTTKNGTGNFSMRWSGVSDPNFALNYFNGNCADKIKFWVRVSNASIVLNRLTVYGYTSASTPYIFPIVYTNKSKGWSFSADTWTEVEIDIRNDYDTKEYRAYWTYISMIMFNFSGGISGNEIFIDGLRLELENPNPTSAYPGFYTFPTAIYMSNSYFSDSNFVFISNHLTSGATYQNPLYMNSMQNTTLGSYTKGGVIYRNNFAFDDASGNVYIAGTNTYKVLGLTMITQDTVGGYGGMSFGCSATGSGTCLVENTNFYGVGDIGGSIKTTFRNIVIGSARYPVRMGTAPIIDGFIYYMPVNTGWVFILENPSVSIKGLTPAEFTGTRIFFSSRNYNLNSENTHNITNIDLSKSTGGLMRLQIYGLYVPAGRTLTQNLKYTLNIEITNETGSKIENANVTIKNVNGSVVASVLTYSNGTIPEQEILARYNAVTSNGASTTTLDWNPRTQGTVLTPHTLTISKEGYETYSASVNMTEKIDWTVALSEDTGTTGGGVVVYSSGERLPEASNYPYLNYEISREKDTFSGLLNHPYIVKKEGN